MESSRVPTCRFASSLCLGRWRASFRGVQRFHFRDFDAADLVGSKSGATLSICIPTLNEAATIGEIVACVRRELVEEIPLVDEIVVIDSSSDDGTREIAEEAGARVCLSSEIAPDTGTHVGKGENLWKAMHAASGSILCFLDGDIAGFHSGFVTGLVGPLLTDPSVDYVKAFYERPISHGDTLHSQGGGRVSEILVRPFLSMFYPELGDILQPLAGEYAARRELLERLSFPTGYGVEIAHLIDLARMGRLESIAQTDLVRRIHRNRDEGDLGDTAFAILRVLMRRLERDGKLRLLAEPSTLHRRWWIDGETVMPLVREIPEPERPPLRGED